jgi:hypothetical protein
MFGKQFSSIELCLKQVDIPGLGELSRYVFNSAFGSYSWDDNTINEATSELSRTLGGSEVVFDTTTSRRFSGDSTLPRSRYYSLSNDDCGWDDHTLLREISAYLTGSTYPGLVSFFDTSMQNSMELLGILAAIPKKNYEALDLSLPSFLIALRPLAPDLVLREAYGRARHYVVQIPFTLTTEVFERVIDLRRPEAQAWLVEEFNSTFVLGDTRFPVLIGRQPPTNFRELLPSLLDQWLGGGWSTGNMAGFFARGVGGDGLIYPSARNDANVNVNDGAVRDSAGWCFVRYESAPEMQITHAFSRASDPWPTTVGFAPSTASWVQEFIPLRGARINHVVSGPHADSWNVEGVAEYNTSLYRLAQAATILKSIGDDAGNDTVSKLQYMALFSAAEDIMRVGTAITASLLGDVRSKANLEAIRLAAGSEFEKAALDNVLKLVAQTPKRFRAEGALAQAWGYQ